MSTKVKGDKIKEGSIPLSALSSDMNIPSYVDFVKKLSDEDNNTTLSIPYTNQVVLVRYDGTRILNSGESTTYSDYGMVFTFTASQASSSLELHIEGNGTLNPFDIKVYKGINKIKKEFLPDDIGGADWNAQEGEAGYIENKPFSKEHVNKALTNYYYDEVLNRIIHASAEGGEAIRLDNDYTIEFTVIDGASLTNPFSVPNIVGEYIVETLMGASYILGVVQFEDSLFVQIYGGPEDLLDIEYDIIKTLKGQYIDNTVIKTTTQTLSDNDKNQALANLGIDPVVWKYIVNPIRLVPDGSCPSDAFELVDTNDPDNYTARFKLPLSCFSHIFEDHYDDRYIVTGMSSDKIHIYAIRMRDDVMMHVGVDKYGTISFYE